MLASQYIIKQQLVVATYRPDPRTSFGPVECSNEARVPVEMTFDLVLTTLIDGINIDLVIVAS